MPRPTSTPLAHEVKAALEQSLAKFVFAAAFPKLAYRSRWPTRLRPRGLVVYIALSALAGTAARTWVGPFFRTMRRRRQQAVDDLRDGLGRDPTDEEILAHLQASHD